MQLRLSTLNTKFSYFRVFSFLVLVLMTVSCSRQKNAFVNRTYHKITARDNSYFNGREKVKESAKTLAESHVDQYDRLLKIFKYADNEKAKALYPDLDEAIKKASIVVQRHSMIFNGEEKNTWVQESYLLIGQAQFYKHDYWAAIETFQFVASSYNTKPIRFRALLWLTQAYLELGKTPDAEYLLDFLKNDKEFPWKKLRGEYYAISANFNIQKENYEKAAEDLKSSIASTKKKQDRIRYSFILAQLYQKANNCDRAFPIYNQVIKQNAPYEMEFNARINRARCFDINSGSAEIKSQLLKMLKDDKNKEYLDQIYYALATIAQKENKEPEAIELLKQSVSVSTVNTNQKALSYLELAEIFFKRPDYRTAQVFYDSTVAFLSTDHPDYFACLSKKNSLGKLVRNLNIISTEDSLLMLAGLSPSERESRVSAVIQKEVAEQERKKEEEEAQKLKEQEQKDNLDPDSPDFISQPNSPPKNNTAITGGNWYFYNQSVISFGFTEFLKKWGNRKLEDNWRRSTKELTIAANPEEEVAEVDSSELLASAERDSIMSLGNEQRKQAYLNAIPVSEDQKKQSADKIIEAYYNAGIIYKEQLSNPKESAADLETLIQKYPENKYLLPSYYNLYRCYLALKDTVKADYYKNILLTKYPESEYSKIITNPNYFKENQKKTAILQVFYENTYRAYINGQYSDVIDRKSTADSLFPPNALSPKFEFLKALAVGKTQPLPEFEASLKTVVTKYPKDSVSTRAQEILDMINKANSPPAENKPAEVKKDSAKTAEPLVNYVLNQDTTQYFVLVFPNHTLDANTMKIKISDYNTEFYSTSDLQISNAFLGADHQFIMVQSFENGDDAVNYFTGIINANVFGGIEPSLVQKFIITPDNFLLLVQSKNAKQYEDFFKANYLENE